jgi:thiol-disulfide isomerase/thioredoxin
MRIVGLLLVFVVPCFACGDAPAPATDGKAAPDAKSTKTADGERATHRVVELAVGDDLPKLLADHAALAKQADLAPYVELWAEWCPPCKKLEAAMGDARIVKAFTGVYLIRLDTDAWGTKLDGTGLDGSTIPVFYELDASGKPTGRRMDGGAWGEDVPENMAPALDGFFHQRS